MAEQEKTLFDGIDCLRQGRLTEAGERFLAVILAEGGFSSLEELDRAVRLAAREKRPANLSLLARSALFGLGLVHAREQQFRDAEDCVLNSAYSSDHPALWILAGTYYLALSDAEVDTAIAYFEAACRASPAWYGRSADAVSRFHKTRLLYYPPSALSPYIEHWERFCREMGLKPDERAVEPEWLASYFELLEEFQETETARLRSEFPS